MSYLSDIFGSMVFNDDVMKSMLSEDVYNSLHKTIEEGKPLDINVANAVASAMKEWAMSKGATHYTHWFQPMTGITAEKHDAFISPGKNGSAIIDFSGKQLIRGESDASSFPSGGLRATFEARGYTAWDPTSYAFVKDKSLYIPTIFCSWGGEVLDKKTPLLRSMERINTESLRILHLLGYDDVKHVDCCVGAEQEYFLTDKKYYNLRKDLIYCGRTLYGAKPPKSQDVEHHYYGAIKPRISSYMSDLDEELWKLGVYAKTKHNEAAPAQHELAPVYTSANTSSDQNQIIMETMKRVADRHGLVCILHEKPFSGVNGSGKHINWSLVTDTGVNLFDRGKNATPDIRFLLFVAAVIKAVDIYQDLLRMSCSTAGNDLRIGGNEAPPAVISMFLGDDITRIFESIEKGGDGKGRVKEEMKIGVDVLPHFMKDTSDRNRTSPFAFTGNKFEFRMPGASLSIAGPIVVINTMVAQILGEFADKLDLAKNIDEEINNIIVEVISNHKRIIFNGDGYSQEWKEEAKKRGLLNLVSTVDALGALTVKKNIDLFIENKIFTEPEIRSRYEILMQNYCDTVHIEARTMLNMARKDLYPASLEFSDRLAKTINHKKSAIPNVERFAEETLLCDIASKQNKMFDCIGALAKCEEEYESKDCDVYEKACYIRDVMLPCMNDLRDVTDSIELVCARNVWPIPGYGKLIFNL